jgi:hypothetical protein
MPANAELSSSSYVDAFASAGVPIFNGVSGPHWEVDRIIHRNGAQASEAHVLIPLAELDQIAPRIAGVTGGPLDDILIGQRCVIKSTSPTSSSESADDAGVTLMIGRVAEINADIRPDMARLLILDDRWILESMMLVGSFWMGGSNDDGEVAYRQGVPWHINERGQPNKIWRAVGSVPVPVMCYPRYGLTDNETPPSPTDTGNTTKATFWTAQDILVAIQFAISQDAYNIVSAAFPWYPVADPDSLVWDSDYASAVIDESTNEFRKAREAVYSGMNVLEAVSEVLRSCGNYALTMEPEGEDKNVVRVVPTRYTGDGSGISLPRPTGGQAATVFVDGIKVTDGQLKEGGRNLYTKFAAAGARVVVQQRVQIRDEGTAVSPFDTDAKMGNLTMQLAAGWDDARKREAEEYYLSLLKITTPVLDGSGNPVECDPGPTTHDNSEAPKSSNPDVDATPILIGI